MKAIYFVLTLVTFGCLSALAQNPSKSTATAYHVVGRCHDYSTALGLKANVYAVINQSRQKLTQCLETGDFDVLLPVSATRLILEMDRYREVNIPVHFTGKIPPKAQFSIANLAAMAKLDSLPVPPDKGSTLALYFEDVNNIDADFKIVNLEKPSNNIQGSHFYKRVKLNGIPFRYRPVTMKLRLTQPMIV